MDELDNWRLCDELNIVQAAILFCGHDPSSDLAGVEDWDIENRPKGYEGIKTAISVALGKKLIEGQLNPILEYHVELEDSFPVEDSIDLTKSWVEVESLRSWLASRGVCKGFFFPTAIGTPDYLDSDHPRYAPKLAAAVKAWLACADESAHQGRSVKNILIKWLREHASEFSLSDDDGNLNEMGIEETAKVANWRPGGGAPKTPGG